MCVWEGGWGGWRGRELIGLLCQCLYIVSFVNLFIRILSESISLSISVSIYMSVFVSLFVFGLHSVSHLSRRLNAFHETKINKDPCKKQAQDDLPAHFTHLRNAACYLEDVSTKKEFCKITKKIYVSLTVFFLKSTYWRQEKLC